MSQTISFTGTHAGTLADSPTTTISTNSSVVIGTSTGTPPSRKAGAHAPASTPWMLALPRPERVVAVRPFELGSIREEGPKPRIGRLDANCNLKSEDRT